MSSVIPFFSPWVPESLSMPAAFLYILDLVLFEISKGENAVFASLQREIFLPWWKQN